MSLNFNTKYNFKAGDRAILDEKFRNGYPVDIVSIGTIFARVKAINKTDDDSWETMINRLTPCTEELLGKFGIGMSTITLDDIKVE